MALGAGRCQIRRARVAACVLLVPGLVACAPLRVASQVRVVATTNPTPGQAGSAPASPIGTPTGSPTNTPTGVPGQAPPVATGIVGIQPRLPLPGLPNPSHGIVALAPNPDAVSSSMELPAPTGLTPSTTPLTRTMHRKGKWVSLTIDDGPDPAHTPQILDLLAAHHIRAVFCVVGEMVVEYPDLVRRIAAEGHLFCNHTMLHSMALGNKDSQTIAAELKRVNGLIHQVVPGAPILWFRAPGAAWTDRLNSVAARLGMQPLAWSVDPADWQRPPASAIVKRIKEQVKPQGVILVHDGGGPRFQTVKALQEIIPWLKSQGYRFDDPAIGKP